MVAVIKDVIVGFFFKSKRLTKHLDKSTVRATLLYILTFGLW